MWFWDIIKSYSWQNKSDNHEDKTEENENLEGLLLREEDLEDKFQWTQKEGKVTYLKDNCGTIDGDIYFSSDLNPK